MDQANNISNWKSLDLPFYIVIQDKSESKKLGTEGNDNNKFKSIDYDILTASKDNHSTENSDLFEKPINIYPEVRYKFEDDADDNDELTKQGQDSLNANDTVIVLDFDKTGEVITDSKCLSSNWQMYHISKLKNSSLSYGGPNNSQNTTNVIIKGTHSDVELHYPSSQERQFAADGNNAIINAGEEDDLTQSVEHIRNMVRLFNERNKQLEQMINLPSVLPK